MARILIVDDNDNIRETLAEILKLNNHEVLSAEDGVQATLTLKEQPVDLLITDLVMPEKGGIEVIREFREVSPNTRIIAISGGWIGPKKALLDSAQTAGADETMAKPVDWDELRGMVKDLLVESGK